MLRIFTHLVGFLLIAQITTQAHAKIHSRTNYENCFIDSGIKESSKISEAVNEKYSPDVYQLFSHGKAGELLINGNWMNAKEISNFLKSNMSSKINHINIYGCDFAKGEKGHEAVRTLERELGLTVSASTNITGLGGDWKLEVGQSNNAVIVVKNYQSSLQTCCVNEYIQNGSFEQYKNCPSYTVGSFISSKPTHWSATSDPELMVVNSSTGCVSASPTNGSGWPASGALSAGQQGYAWAGTHSSEMLTDTLACTLPAGTYTVTFWAGYVINSPYTAGSPLGVYNSAGTLLGSSATVNNVLSPSNQTWKQYSITFTTTTPTNTLGFQATAGASYLYLDNISLQNGTPLTFTSGVTSSTVVSNTCPSTSVNLNNYITGTCNSGYSLTWFATQNSATSYSNPVATPSALTSSGTYYAACYNATSNCTIQQNTTGLKVNIVSCCNAGPSSPVYTKN